MSKLTAVTYINNMENDTNTHPQQSSHPFTQGVWLLSQHTYLIGL